VGRPLPAVGALVFNDEGKILLVKRKYPPGQGRWSIPGGHLEYGETLEEAVVRELEEETGIKGIPECVIAIAEIIRYEGSEVKYHFIIVDFLVKPIGGSLRISDESLDAGYYTIDDALNLDLTQTTRDLLIRVKDIISKHGINGIKDSVKCNLISGVVVK